MFVFSVGCHVSKLKMFPHVTFTVQSVTNHKIWIFSISNPTWSHQTGTVTLQMVMDDLTEVSTQSSCTRLEREAQITDSHQYEKGDSLVVPVRGKHTHGASWSIKEPGYCGYCGSDWVQCLLCCSIKQFPGAGAWSHNTGTSGDHSRERRDHNKYCDNNIMWHRH